MTSPQMTYIDSELELASLESARFSWAGRDYRGKPLLGPDLAERLRTLEAEHETYGRELYEAAFPRNSELREGLHEAILAAEREKSRLRFRLHLSPELPDWVHALYWELLTDPDRGLALARSPDTAFSRYLDVRQAQGEPASERPRLLCVVSAPSDIARYGMAEIRREEVLHLLKESVGVLTDAVAVTVLDSPATLEKLRERLMGNDGFQLLHFFGHGLSRSGRSALVLENQEGQAHLVEEELLAEVFLGVRELRLVTLVACHGGAPSSSDPFSGLAGRLIQRGLPAVIAMRRAVSVSSALSFTQHFYRHLAQTGRADAAVNEARQQLYLAQSRGVAWSSPILYSRLADGRLWIPQKESLETEEPSGATMLPLLRLSFRRLRSPLPWLPALFALGLNVLGFWPVEKTEALFDLRVSRVAFRLAESTSLIERLALKELAASQLAALRLPLSLPGRNRWAQSSEGGMKGFLVSALGNRSHVTLNTPPLSAGTEVVIERQGQSSYRVTVAKSNQELRVTFQGDVILKLLDSPVVTLHLDHPDSLVLYPQSGAAEVDVKFSRFALDSFSSNIRIDSLDFLRVVDRQTTTTTLPRNESTLLDGEVQIQATGERHRLKKGESVRCSAISGLLTDLHLGEDGIRFRFKGIVSEIELVEDGLQPKSLTPSVLSLWLTQPTGFAVQVISGALAVITLLLTALDIQPRITPAKPRMSP